jgi:hypothetical protein
MKRIKTPSIASIHLDVFSRRITPAGYPVLLKTQWLKEIFSFITETPAPYNPFIIVTASLPGYNYQVQNICTPKRSTFTKNFE